MAAQRYSTLMKVICFCCHLKHHILRNVAANTVGLVIEKVREEEKKKMLLCGSAKIAEINYMKSICICRRYCKPTCRR